MAEIPTDFPFDVQRPGPREEDRDGDERSGNGRRGRRRSADNGAPPETSGRRGDDAPIESLDFDWEPGPATPPPSSTEPESGRLRSVLGGNGAPGRARPERRDSDGRDGEGAAGADSFEDLLERQARRPSRSHGDGSGDGVALPTIRLPQFDGLRDRIVALRERAPALPRPLIGRPRRDGAGPPPRSGQRFPGARGGRPGGPRVKKLRLFLILSGLGLLAMVSTVFGMMMAVAGDLPSLENRAEYNAAKNSVVLDAFNEKIGTLTSNNKRLLVESSDISQYVKQAVVAVEDQRFYEHRGVDFEGIGRAVVADVTSFSTSQGASTITQQFVKNALEAQGSRTIFQKLRESALAYQLERQWDKDKILTQYLNTIYFGEGAYGIEAAARTYFGFAHPECGGDTGEECSSALLPSEAALLAGMISSPSAYSPRANPEAALDRRNLVLEKMKDQGLLTETDYEQYVDDPIPPAAAIEPPDEDTLSPYFTSWLRQQLVDRYGPGKAFGGGLQVKTTLDLDLQETVEEIAYNTLSGVEPTASVVVIDNKTGGVRAMVGGSDYEEHPFNLATQGHRQPGSAFKPFTLATALENGRSTGEVFPSQVKTFPVPNSPGEKFIVHNYEDQYLGSASIADALTYSDNSIFAELGLQVGTRKIADTAEEMGVQTNVSTNPAMTLGGLKKGVTPLEMAYAFSTFANDGERVSGKLDSLGDHTGPVAILEVRDDKGHVIDKNETRKKQVISESTASAAVDLMANVVAYGTGENAATGGFAWGKTGTTENNGDAWFCGGTEDFTACVWVGHADSNTPMETEYGGQPVDGGTFPADIWRMVMLAAESIQEQHEAGEDEAGASVGYSSGSSGYSGSSSEGGGDSSSGFGQSSAPAPAPSSGGTGGAPAGGAGL